MGDSALDPEALPPLALYPSEKIRSILPPQEWQACLDTWISCVEIRLRLSDQQFQTLRLSQNASGFPFLRSYLGDAAGRSRERQAENGGGRSAHLRHHCLLLLRRLLLGTVPPLDCAAKELFDCLTNACLAFNTSPAWRETLKMLWKRSQREVSNAIDQQKTEFILQSAQLSDESLVADLRRGTALVKALPETGQRLMTGTDYIETLAAAYEQRTAQSPPSNQALDSLTLLTFTCLRSLISQNGSSSHLLLDHLYLLRSRIDSSKGDKMQSPTLLSSLVVSTSFLRHLETHLATSEGKRGQSLLEWLKTYRESTLQLHTRRLVKHRDVKGKRRDEYGGDHEMHVHKAEKVSQVHELFPNLSDTYILQLLDNFSDNIEDATSALLEPQTLPQHLRQHHGSAENEDASSKETTLSPGLVRHPTNPSATRSVPERRNVFDDDDFDKLRISKDRLHKGRRQVQDHAETNEERARSKAAIMSALAAFDADDDERDDTYDVADVGGAVDNTLDTDERPSTNEEILYQAWSSDVNIFARDSKTRLSQPRQQLKRATAMTDEQIEGWALMLGRDENMQNRLKQKYSAATSFMGRQTVLGSTKWRNSPSASDEESSEADGGDSDGRRQGLAGIRGHRNFADRGRGRGGGSTSGPAQSESTQAARKRKEQGRGRGGANHNRREGRAKKIGRGMAGPIS